MKVTLLGAGAWGTAMAAQAARHLPSADVCLWSRSPGQIAEIKKTGQNQAYLPGATLPSGLELEAHFEKAIARLSSDDLLVIATPMAGLSDTISQVLELAKHPLHIVWLCKGLEPDTALLPHQVVERQDRLHHHGLVHSYGALSGPSFAKEVAQGMPCALTVASDGLDLGLNARAAVLTRGLAEMMRLVKAAGGKSETCMGLTGVGDLILTATGDLSRNRQVGLALAAGKSLQEILDNLGHVAEGVLCAAAVGNLAKRLGVEMPITASMGEVLAGKLTPLEAVTKLMGRDPKIET